MDFMNLNQAAHGDREFGYHPDAHAACAARPSSVTSATRGARPRRRPGRAPRSAYVLRATLRLARFGDNMRDVAVTEGDKAEAQIVFGMSVNTYGVNDLVAVVDAVADADVDALVAEYDDLYDVGPS